MKTLGQMARSLMVAVAPMLAVGPVAAVVIPVTGYDDSTFEDGICTLSEAILSANSDLPIGGCPAGSGADTIVLDHDISLASEYSFQTALPRVTSRITVRGNGFTIERSLSAPADFRLFYVDPAGELTLRDVSLTNGRGGGPLGEGGAIFSEGTLRLHNVDAFSNLAQFGGAIFSRSRLELTDCQIASNQAVSGGGVYSEGRASITDSLFALNTATFQAGGSAGAIVNRDGVMTITRTTLWANASSLGGAIENSGTLRVVNSTISANSASGAGGGIYNAYETVVLINTTLSGNMVDAGAEGAAVYGTHHGSITFTNSLIGNGPGGLCAGTGPILDGGGNRADDPTCAPIPGDLSGLDPTLADNGGPTWTHALLPTSNAMDGAGACGQPIDQRGALRDGPCDSGSYESGADDHFETSGSGGSDDTCFGHPGLIGRPEHHLHTRDASDWLWFRPVAGATYEIETANLRGSSDTELALWRGCTTPLAENDDAPGLGLASKITWVATNEDAAQGLDIWVRDFWGAAEDRGYDVITTCVGGPCTTCPVSGGTDFAFVGVRVYTHHEVEACNSIVASDASVEAGGIAVLRAGETVEIQNGFAVDQGGALVVAIDADLGNLGTP